MEYKIIKTKKRTIYAPDKELKKMQRDVLKIIKQVFKLSFSIRDCAKVHTNQKWILKMDIKNFYESVSDTQIKRAIDGIFNNINKPVQYNKNEMYAICTLNGKLPTGAVTSSYIANMILEPIDIKIKNYCKIRKINYSRYMDDIFLSGANKNNLRLAEMFTAKLLQENGFKQNDSKTKYITTNRRQDILGLVVNNKTAKLPQKEKRKFRAIFYNYLRATSQEQKEKVIPLKKLDFDTVNGYLSYIRSVDSEFYNSMKFYIRYNISVMQINKNKEIKILLKSIYWH